MRHFESERSVLAVLLLGAIAPAALLLGWFAAVVAPPTIVDAAPSASTPLPPMTPLPMSTAPPPLAAALGREGFGAEPHARRLAFAPDGSGDVVFSVGKTYLSVRTLFRLEADDTGILSNTASALLPLPEIVQGLPELRSVAATGDYIAGAVNWHDEAASRYAYADLYQIGVDGEQVESLTQGRYRINEFAPSPEGDVVALLLADGRLLALDVASGLTTTLASDLITPAGVAAATLAWSPDGVSIAVGSHPDPGGARLERIEVSTGRRELLAELPGMHQAVPIYLADGSLRFVLHEAAGSGDGVNFVAQLFALDPFSGSSPRLLSKLVGSAGALGIVRELVLHPAGDRLLYALDGAVWAVSVQGGAPHRLSALDVHVSAGPVVTRTTHAGDRVAWIERFERDPADGGIAAAGSAGATEWRVYGTVLP